MAFVIHHSVIPRDEMTIQPVIPGYIRFRQNVFLRYFLRYF
jgi:hypothetical protein